MIAKRGVKINAVHFHSYPYTSDRAKEKVLDLARILSESCCGIRVHIVPFTKHSDGDSRKVPGGIYHADYASLHDAHCGTHCPQDGKRWR